MYLFYKGPEIPCFLPFFHFFFVEKWPKMTILVFGNSRQNDTFFQNDHFFQIPHYLMDPFFEIFFFFLNFFGCLTFGPPFLALYLLWLWGFC